MLVTKPADQKYEGVFSRLDRWVERCLRRDWHQNIDMLTQQQGLYAFVASSPSYFLACRTCQECAWHHLVENVDETRHAHHQELSEQLALLQDGPFSALHSRQVEEACQGGGSCCASQTVAAAPAYLWEEGIRYVHGVETGCHDAVACRSNTFNRLQSLRTLTQHTCAGRREHSRESGYGHPAAACCNAHVVTVPGE